MKLTSLVFALLSIASVTIAVPSTDKDKENYVQSNKLRRLLTRSALQKHAAKLQQFANQDPDKNRAFGGKGHQATVDWLYETFKKYPDYYTVEKQEFVYEYAYGTSIFSAEGESYDSQYFTYSPSTNGLFEGELAATNNLGCEEADYPASVAGKVALVSRGACEFGLKAVLAGKAGAKAIVIYNNIPGSITGGTYGAPVRELGPYVPGVMISQEAGLSLVADLAAGSVGALLEVDAVLENRTTHNVIVDSVMGDKNNVIVSGGHSDSVGAGPGINDDGSGTIGILEVALQLMKFKIKNAVRFCFWSAEEFGLVGSEYYVAQLPIAEQNKIKLYLNFDMIASPNYGLFVYDGDGSAFNLTGPTGSAEIEKLFEDYFEDVGEASRPTEFSGRSDYGPFLAVGIPAGGLFTGAEGIMTEEEAALWNGKAGVAYDVNYHKFGDDYKNVHWGAFITNTKAIAHSVATYAISTDSLPPRTPAKAKRQIPQATTDHHHTSRCGHEDPVL